MREIKFRAWNSELAQMYILVKQDFLGGTGIDDPKQGCETAIWMQFTGLKDKNGVEIYEGDVVRVDGKRAEVIWDSAEASFRFKAEDGTRYVMAWEPDGEVVIGNIYENPELLATQ